MAAQKLTDSKVLKAQAQERVYMLWDSVVPGFHLRVYPSGAKTYAVRFQRHDGTKVVATIGSVSVHTLDDAREQARKLREMHDQGKDARAFLQKERKAETVSDLVNKWKEEYRGDLKPSSQRGYDGFTRIIVKHLGNRLVRDLTFHDVRDLHRKIAKEHPVSANRVVAILSSLMSIAKTEGWTSSNPCQGIRKKKEHKRSRTASAEELAGLGEAMSLLEEAGKLDSAHVGVIRFLALSGLRKGEVLGLKWKDVDEKLGTITLESHKTDEKEGARVVVVNKQMSLLLAKQATTRILGKDKLVFPGAPSVKIPKKGEPVSVLKGQIQSLPKSWEKVCKEAGVTGLTPHDLRRTFTSVLADLGYPLAIGDILVGHSLGKIRDTYFHLSMDGILRDASDATSAWIWAAMSGKPVKSGKKVGAKAKKQA